MIKYHITSEGTVARCRSLHGRCPYNKHNHFNTKEEAQAFSDKMFANDYNLLPKHVGLESNPMRHAIEDPDSLVNKIKQITGVKSRGYSYECYMTSKIAEGLGLNNIAAYDSKTDKIVSLSGNEDYKEVHERASRVLADYYKKIGQNVDDIDKLVRVMYYNDAGEVLVQSGGSNVLDAAVIGLDDNVSVAEIKRLGKSGAQVPNAEMKLSALGYIQTDSSLPDTVRAALSGAISYENALGTNYKLKLDKRESAKYFIDKYKEKGATMFVYSTEHGNVLAINLDRSTDELAEEFLSRGILVDLKLRTNLSNRKTKPEDFNDNIIGLVPYFNGAVPRGETIKLKDINRGKLKEVGDTLRMREFILPFSAEEIDKLPDNYEFKKADMKYAPLILTGEVRLKRDY